MDTDQHFQEEVAKLKQELYKKELHIKELQSLITKDHLTGLYNRRGFEEEVGRIFNDIVYTEGSSASPSRFNIDSISILFFDIDNFKKLNDDHGHKVGDQALRQVTQIIANKVRDVDFVCRWGGEEIVAALIGSDEKHAYEKAEEIRQAIKSRVKLNDISVTVSIGVASFEKGLSLGDLIDRADKAMYVAKHERGKDCAV